MTRTERKNRLKEIARDAVTRATRYGQTSRRSKLLMRRARDAYRHLEALRTLRLLKKSPAASSASPDTSDTQ